MFCVGAKAWLESNKPVGINYSEASISDSITCPTDDLMMNSRRLEEGDGPSSSPYRGWNLHTMKTCSNFLSDAMLLQAAAIRNEDSGLVSGEEVEEAWDRYQEAIDNFQNCFVFLVSVMPGEEPNSDDTVRLLNFFNELDELSDAFAAGEVGGLSTSISPSSSPSSLGPTCPDPSVPACQMFGGGGTDP
jgi:hypothetical protein